MPLKLPPGDSGVLKIFWRDERGAAAIEYAILAMLISLVIVATVRTIGGNLNTLYYQKVANNLT